MSHNQQYLNGTVLGPVVCLWPHLFQARQFKGKGDPRFDVTLILTPEQHAQLKPNIENLAVSAFTANEYNRTGAVEIEGVAPPKAFGWPYVPVMAKRTSPKLAEVFPGHYVVSAKAFEDSPPDVLIPNPQNPGTYIPMPEGQRSQLVFDGAMCYAGVDFATYENGENVGIRVQLNFIVFYGAGEKVSVGSKPDANTALAGVNIQMQTPAGMGTQGAVGGMPVQSASQVAQQGGQQQQPVQQQGVQQQGVQQQGVQQQGVQQQGVQQQGVQQQGVQQQGVQQQGVQQQGVQQQGVQDVDFT